MEMKMEKIAEIEILSKSRKKRRPIIDKVVEDRKYLHPAEYETVLRLPIGMNDVANYDNEIRLKDRKADLPDNIDYVNAIIQKEMVTLDESATPELIIKGKPYTVQPMVYSIIRAIALCAVSKSEIIGDAFADAINDWVNSAGCRYSEVSDLYSYVYIKAYTILVSALKLDDVVETEDCVTVEAAIREMSAK
jgi:hypothetical protein